MSKATGALALLRKLLSASPEVQRAKVTVPTEAQFFRDYAQHVDIRDPATAAERLEAIRQGGWQPGFGPNTLPPYSGGAPLDIISKLYGPRAGHQVYLAPKSATRNAGNGRAITKGWIPEPYEVIVPEADYPNMYEEYLKAMQRHFLEKGTPDK